MYLLRASPPAKFFWHGTKVDFCDINFNEDCYFANPPSRDDREKNKQMNKDISSTDFVWLRVGEKKDLIRSVAKLHSQCL